MNAHHGDRPLLAAPLLGEQGGGIGQVSEMLWQVMRDTWGKRASVVTLLTDGPHKPHAADKVRFALTLTGRLLMSRPSWVMFSHLGLARVDRYVPSLLQSPYAVFLHGIEAWKPLHERDRKTLSRASLRVANSEFTARAVAAANPGIGHISVCPLALPAPVHKDMARRGDAGHSVLIVGRLASGERYKGHDQLLAAWPIVRSLVPDATLVIAGDGDDAPRLRRLASALDVADSVRFTGYLTREELEQEYAQSALFAMPSRGEGFGLVYLEAMAHGLPCIGSIHDAAREVISEGETGWLVDPDNTAALGRAVAELLKSRETRARMGEAGRRRVARQFTYDRFRRDITRVVDAAFHAGVEVA
jgi:phosphatidylinositol alpha-1,6-mannosyltransferase